MSQFGFPMRIYVSGGMTGWPDNNREEFELAKDALLSLGNSVITPVDLGEADGEVLDGDGFNADDHEYEGFLERDLALLTKDNFDAVVFVRGWKTSGGAGREGRKAIEHGLLLFTWDRKYPSTLMSLTPEAFLNNSRTERLRREEAADAVRA